MNLGEALATTARRIPERPAFVFRGAPLSYRELAADAARMGSALTAAGVQPGDRVAVWLSNDPAFAVAMYGAWWAGAVCVPMHAMFTENEAHHVLTDSGVRVLVCGDAQYRQGGGSRLGEKVGSCERVIVHEGEERGADGGLVAFLETGSPEAAPVELDPDELAVIAYTSGTEGRPKGAMLTHANLRANIEQMQGTPVALREDDVALCVLPLFHIFGLNVVLNLCVHVGATVVLLERFDAVESLAAIREWGVTVVSAVPPVYLAWLGVSDVGPDDFAGVRVAVSGAAPLPREVLEGFGERFGVTIWEGYGLTETAPVLTSMAISGVAKPGSVGRPVPDVELRLIDEDGQEALPGDPGEVVVRGPNVFRGYWEQPDATAAVLSEGWFRTADVGVLDDEGDLFLVDRKNDLILVSGFNVYPKEVEQALRGHPKVVDCAVIGAPDDYQGEQVKAFVVLAPDSGATAEELIDHCGTLLAPYKVPSVIEFVPEVPRNIIGKALRRTFRD